MSRNAPLLLVALLATALPRNAQAQERIPTEEAQRIARALNDEAAKLKDHPLALGEVDVDKPFAVRQDHFGAMAVPVKKLRAEAIAEAGKEPTPIGQFWLRDLVPLGSSGSPVDAAKVRTIKLEGDGQTVVVTLYLFGIRKSEKGDLELVLFGKDKEPALVLPVEKAEAAQSYPIEMEGREEGEGGAITLFLTSKYRAHLKVAATDD